LAAHTCPSPAATLLPHQLLEAIADPDDLAELTARQLLELVLDDPRERVVVRVPARERGHERVDALDRIVGGRIECLLQSSASWSPVTARRRSPWP
jgi:hypothetical protein